MGILVMFLLPLHDQGMCFHFFCFISSSISLLNFLRFSATRSLTFLVTFIPRYLDFCAAMVNGSAFLSTLSVSTSLVLRMPSVPWRNFWTLYFAKFLGSVSEFFDGVLRDCYVQCDVTCEKWQFRFLFSKLVRIHFVFMSELPWLIVPMPC